MNERQTESVLFLAGHTMRFLADHPYLATGIFGAGLGSAVTYRVMTRAQKGSTSVRNIFTPKVYKMELPVEDLRHILHDPSAELRWETPDMTVIVTSEETVPLKQLSVEANEELPVIEADEQ